MIYSNRYYQACNNKKQLGADYNRMAVVVTSNALNLTSSPIIAVNRHEIGFWIIRVDS